MAVVCIAMFGWGPGGRTRRTNRAKKGREPCSNSTVFATAAALGLCRHGRVGPIGRGLEEYLQACASCHGIAGQGNGPLAEFMTVDRAGSDPHRSENDGVFPMLQVIQIIDGRTGVRGHGSEMPVWGSRYQVGDHPGCGRIRGRAPGPGPHPGAGDASGIDPGMTAAPLPAIGRGQPRAVSRDDPASCRRSRHRA
jgi:mono/diheme cytochrome c family protein